MFRSPDLLFGVFIALVGWALAALALYWVIRLAVRHALQDASGRNRDTEFPLSQPSPPSRPASTPVD